MAAQWLGTLPAQPSFLNEVLDSLQQPVARYSDYLAGAGERESQAEANALAASIAEYQLANEKLTYEQNVNELAAMYAGLAKGPYEVMQDAAGNEFLFYPQTGESQFPNYALSGIPAEPLLSGEQYSHYLRTGELPEWFVADPQALADMHAFRREDLNRTELRPVSTLTDPVIRAYFETRGKSQVTEYDLSVARNDLQWSIDRAFKLAQLEDLRGRFELDELALVGDLLTTISDRELQVRQLDLTERGLDITEKLGLGNLEVGLQRVKVSLLDSGISMHQLFRMKEKDKQDALEEAARLAIMRQGDIETLGIRKEELDQRIAESEETLGIRREELDQRIAESEDAMARHIESLGIEEANLAQRIAESEDAMTRYREKAEEAARQYDERFAFDKQKHEDDLGETQRQYDLSAISRQAEFNTQQTNNLITSLVGFGLDLKGQDDAMRRHAATLADNMLARKQGLDEFLIDKGIQLESVRNQWDQWWADHQQEERQFLQKEERLTFEHKADLDQQRSEFDRTYGLKAFDSASSYMLASKQFELEAINSAHERSIKDHMKDLALREANRAQSMDEYERMMGTVTLLNNFYFANEDLKFRKSEAERDEAHEKFAATMAWLTLMKPTKPLASEGGWMVQQPLFRGYDSLGQPMVEYEIKETPGEFATMVSGTGQLLQWSKMMDNWVPVEGEWNEAPLKIAVTDGEIFAIHPTTGRTVHRIPVPPGVGENLDLRVIDGHLVVYDLDKREIVSNEYIGKRYEQVWLFNPKTKNNELYLRGANSDQLIPATFEAGGGVVTELPEGTMYERTSADGTTYFTTFDNRGNPISARIQGDANKDIEIIYFEDDDGKTYAIGTLRETGESQWVQPIGDTKRSPDDKFLVTKNGSTYDFWEWDATKGENGQWVYAGTQEFFDGALSSREMDAAYRAIERARKIAGIQSGGFFSYTPDDWRIKANEFRDALAGLFDAEFGEKRGREIFEVINPLSFVYGAAQTQYQDWKDYDSQEAILDEMRRLGREKILDPPEGVEVQPGAEPAPGPQASSSSPSDASIFLDGMVRDVAQGINLVNTLFGSRGGRSGFSSTAPSSSLPDVPPGDKELADAQTTLQPFASRAFPSLTGVAQLNQLGGALSSYLGGLFSPDQPVESPVQQMATDDPDAPRLHWRAASYAMPKEAAALIPMSESLLEGISKDVDKVMQLQRLLNEEANVTIPVSGDLDNTTVSAFVTVFGSDPNKLMQILSNAGVYSE